MNAELEALARRAVACKHWRWMQGMQTRDFTRVCYEVSGYPKGWDEWDNTCADCKGGIVALTSSCLPDLSDPATLGCLLALVRETWAKPHAYVEFSDKWKVAFYCDVGTHAFSSTTEAAALVAALEGAP